LPQRVALTSVCCKLCFIFYALAVKIENYFWPRRSDLENFRALPHLKAETIIAAGELQSSIFIIATADCVTDRICVDLQFGLVSNTKPNSRRIESACGLLLPHGLFV